MDFKEVMKTLEAAGSAQTRKTYSRHGVGEKMFGVSFANLYALQKKIKVDHALAQQLWATGNYDARVLATLIGDPQAMTDKQAEEWVKGIDNYCLADMYAKFLGKTPLGRKKAEKWNKSKDEWIGQTGWALIGGLALNDQTLPDDYFESYLKIIETEIHNRKNRVRHEMNGALIAIGMRNPKMEKRAVEVAKKIGKVVVDHGETSCKTPDAASYIKKALEYRDKKKAKAAAK